MISGDVIGVVLAYSQRIGGLSRRRVQDIYFIKTLRIEKRSKKFLVVTKFLKTPTLTNEKLSYMIEKIDFFLLIYISRVLEMRRAG